MALLNQRTRCIHAANTVQSEKVKEKDRGRHIIIIATFSQTPGAWHQTATQQIQRAEHHH